jgi:hypothetical protein
MLNAFSLSLSLSLSQSQGQNETCTASEDRKKACQPLTIELMQVIRKVQPPKVQNYYNWVPK